jgi:hypothetical protein
VALVGALAFKPIMAVATVPDVLRCKITSLAAEAVPNPEIVNSRVRKDRTDPAFKLTLSADVLFAVAVCDAEYL